MGHYVLWWDYGLGVTVVRPDSCVSFSVPNEAEADCEALLWEGRFFFARLPDFSQLNNFWHVLDLIIFLSDRATGVVAFFAKIAGFTESSSQDTTIPFDVVDLNIGNGYDPDTGAFTPPASGIYELSYEVLADGSCGTGNLCVELKVNSVTVSISCSEVFASGGTSVTVELSTGDTVTVAVDSAGQCEVLYPSSVYNKFSGHLVYQII